MKWSVSSLSWWRVAALDCSVRWRQQWRTQHDTSTKRHSNGPSYHYGGDDIGDCSDLWRQRWRQRLNNDIIRTQDADNATLHWDWNPVRRPKAVTGHGSAGRRPSLACTGHGSAGRRPSLGTGVPAEGRHWPALGTGVPGRRPTRRCPFGIVCILGLDLLLDCHIGKSKKQPGIVNSESKNWVLEEVLEGGALWLGLALGVRRTHGGRVTCA